MAGVYLCHRSIEIRLFKLARKKVSFSFLARDNPVYQSLLSLVLNAIDSATATI
jgi:hypothetical protein